MRDRRFITVCETVFLVNNEGQKNTVVLSSRPSSFPVTHREDDMHADTRFLHRVSRLNRNYSSIVKYSRKSVL